MRLLVVKVHRNELNEQRVDIPPHELPVLAYVHGEENCKILGELIVDRDVPSAAEEYSRLAQRYGRDKANESFEPRVSAVYGAGMRGEQALQQAIDFGQREEVPVEAFLPHAAEPAHGSPSGLIPMRATQIKPLAHEGPTRGKRKRKSGPMARPEGRSAPNVAELEVPAPLRQGVMNERRSKTAKAQRAKSGMASGK